MEGARSCVVYAQTNQIYVAGQAALFNYSTSKMIQRLGLESETPNHVLILTIYNAQYPVNVDVIHQVLLMFFSYLVYLGLLVISLYDVVPNHFL